MITVYITDSEIQYIVGRKSAGRVKIDRFGSIILEKGIVENGKIINKTEFSTKLKQLKIVSSSKGMSVNILLDNRAVIVRVVKIPILPASKVKGIIKNEMFDYVDTKKEYFYDYSVLEGAIRDQRQGKIMCIAAEKSMMLDIQQIFKENKMRIASIDIDQSAIIKYVKNNIVKDQDTFIIGVIKELSINSITMYFKERNTLFIS